MSPWFVPRGHVFLIKTAVMKKLLTLLVLLSVAGYGQAAKKEGFTTVLKGTVHGRDSKALYLCKAANDVSREIKPELVIPVEDGKFEYTLTGDHIREYNLIFLEELQRGSWWPQGFFPDADTVFFELHAEDNRDDNMVRGGPLNGMMSEFEKQREELFGSRTDQLWDEMDVMRDNDTYYSDAAKALDRLIGELNSRAMAGDEEAFGEVTGLYKKRYAMDRRGELLSAEAKVLRDKADAIYEEQKEWQDRYIMENPNLLSFSLLVSELFYMDAEDDNDMERIERMYDRLSAANPGHIYNDQAGDMINALKVLVPGGAFVDFTAPDLDGNMHTLSEEIAGKVAVIDLWATWCGPCINASNKLIPLYEQYRDKGFTVVGVAREYKNTDTLVKALEKYAYPWLNLVELDDRARIWDKYGCSNGAGGMFLVDENGRVVSVSPEPEEIVEYLKSRFD